MDTKNIMEELILLPKDILKMILDYDESPITLKIRFDIDCKNYGILFIDFIDKDKYNIRTNGQFRLYNKNTEFKCLKTIFETKLLKKYIIKKLKTKIIDEVYFSFINTKKCGYKKLYNDVDFETNNISKYHIDTTLDEDKKQKKFMIKVIKMLNEYLDIQQEIFM